MVVIGVPWWGTPVRVVVNRGHRGVSVARSVLFSAGLRVGTSSAARAHAWTTGQFILLLSNAVCGPDPCEDSCDGGVGTVRGHVGGGRV